MGQIGKSVKKRAVGKATSLKNGSNRNSNHGNKSPQGQSRAQTIIIIIIIVITVSAALGYFFMSSSPSSPLSSSSPKKVFVSVSDHVERASQDVPCSSDYEQESFHGCKPERCGRVVMDDLVSQEDAKYLLRVAQKGLALGGSSGGASILDLHSGALSKDSAFIDIYRLLKTEKIDLLTETDFTVYKNVKNQIHNAIAQEFGISPEKLYLTKPSFFSRMNMTEPKTVHDEYWHPHVDKMTYGSFHYTSLLYLTTYQRDFDGGRFIFVDKDAVNRTVEPKLGRVSFFTSGSENVHYVERLKEGVRYAITISFTCDPKKAILDPKSR